MNRLVAIANCTAYAACFLWGTVPRIRTLADVRGLLRYLGLCAGILAVLVVGTEGWRSKDFGAQCR